MRCHLEHMLGESQRRQVLETLQWGGHAIVHNKSTVAVAKPHPQNREKVYLGVRLIFIGRFQSARIPSVKMSVPLAVVLATSVIFLPILQVHGIGNRPRLDATQLFSLVTNSTCGGDPPTLFESRSGEFMNCSVGEHNASFAVDGDPNTWWQSQNGDDPVVLTFSLTEVTHRAFQWVYPPFRYCSPECIIICFNLQARTSLSLVLINLYIAHFPPQTLTIEVRARGSSDFSLVQAYVLSDQDGLCIEFDELGIPCSNYSVGNPDISGNTNFTVLSCPLDVPMVSLMVTLWVVMWMEGWGALSLI